ncbi:hypothetical protein ABEF95_010855 [Exophiala dermatitidis]
MIPWSSLSSSESCPDWRIELNEHNLSHYVDKGGPSSLDDSMNVCMLESAHERRFTIAQLGVSNVGFEAEHRARIEYTFHRTKSHFTAHALDERFHPDTSLLADLYLFDFRLSVDHYNAYEPLPSVLAIVDDSVDCAAPTPALGGSDMTCPAGLRTDTTCSPMGPPIRTAAATTSTPTTTTFPTPPTPMATTTPAPAPSSAPAPCKPPASTSHLTLHQLMNPEPEAEPGPGPASGTKLQSHQSESKPQPRPFPNDQSRKRKRKSKSKRMPSPTFTTLRGIDTNMKVGGSVPGTTAAATATTASTAYPVHPAPPTTSVVSVKDILVPVPETTSEEDEDEDKDGDGDWQSKKKKQKPPSQERAGTRTISFARANNVPTLEQASRTRREARMRKLNKKGDPGDGSGGGSRKWI